MKNHELIKKLKKYNLEADVSLTTSEDITLSYISEHNGKTLTPSTTKQIFIEPTDECVICDYQYMDEHDIRWCSFYDSPCKEVDECYQFGGLY